MRRLTTTAYKNYFLLLALTISVSARGTSFFNTTYQKKFSNDSTKSRITVDLLLSSNNLLHDISNGKISKSIFYSVVPYEFQIRKDKHIVGISYMRNYSSDKEQVNGVEYSADVLRHRFNVNYLHEFSKNKAFVLQAGIGYYLKKSDSLDILYSSIENPYTRRVSIENGVAGVFRVGVNFGRFLGLVLESQLYFGSNKYKYESVYPLTPSQNAKYSNNKSVSHIFLPSNLFLKIKLF